jgi:hypothetical protein
MVRPDTRVTVPGATVVAGRDAYQLAIAPRSSQSLVGRIMIAVDSKTHIPLSVQVFARGASSPAFQIGFTSLSLARPAMSNFTFSPPPGAKVKTVRVPAGHPGLMPGAGWMPGEPSKFGHPGVTIPHVRAPLAGARTFGTGWLTVVAVPAGRLTHGPVAGSGQAMALVRVLLNAATPVHGSWGSGRLLRTNLLCVLVTSKGELLAGAVTPAVLYADAAKIR